MTADDREDRTDIALSDEAIEWLVRLNFARADDAERAAFGAWRGRSVAHEAAAREAETIRHGLGIAGDRVRETERKERGQR